MLTQVPDLALGSVSTVSQPPQGEQAIGKLPVSSLKEAGSLLTHFREKGLEIVSRQRLTVPTSSAWLTQSHLQMLGAYTRFCCRCHPRLAASSGMAGSLWICVLQCAFLSWLTIMYPYMLVCQKVLMTEWPTWPASQQRQLLNALSSIGSCNCVRTPGSDIFRR